ncbi:MAG: PepSY-like domain-containing protein [Prevotellaceae bacterium]|jgi:hypothetical protein|nr:PepSY-like domain-containing protein [Prevotellaceae bacterium]
MKKFLALLFVAFVAIPSFSFAQMGDVITQDINQLPAAARSFIGKYFADVKVSYIKIDKELLSTDYEVLLTDRTEISFDGKGEWTEVDCKRIAVPAVLVPDYIVAYVKSSFPDQIITKIERNRWGTEVELLNDISFRFNKSGRMVEADD